MKIVASQSSCFWLLGSLTKFESWKNQKRKQKFKNYTKLKTNLKKMVRLGHYNTLKVNWKVNHQFENVLYTITISNAITV
ncbi:hypothetical protein XENTR_v10008137 [Xenopus tropicalis]|nr:hypothetical protein XENTR_v10008137 [Xenopus tropicalis]